MTNRKHRRTQQARSSILKYLVFAFIVCVLSTYFIYKHITSPHAGGIPRVFLQEITSNTSRVIVKLNSNQTFSKYLHALKSGNTLMHVNRNGNVHNIFSCLLNDSSTILLNTSSFECSHLMNLTGSSIGRTGNQLFQMASLLGTAFKHNYTPVVRPTFPLNRWFDLPNVIDLTLINNKQYSANRSGTYSESIDSISHLTNWSLQGYFQSYKYFHDAEHIVRNALKIKSEYINNARDYLLNVTKKGLPNVCVHIRRGDMTAKQSQKDGYSVPKLGYIDWAMNFFRRKLKNKVQFIIVSDGMFWCLDNVQGDDIIYSPFRDTPDDLALMTSCDHAIITSGTFGWWGAWLADGITVYYKGYPGKGSWLEKQINVSDYYPPHWIGLW